MRIVYKNTQLEKTLIFINVLTAAAVVASIVMLFGFYEPLLPVEILYTVQLLCLFVFVGEKLLRSFNSVSKKDFWAANWLEIPLIVVLLFVLFGAGSQ